MNELFAESVASYDAPMITTGGFIVGTMGNNEQAREFARAYCSLRSARFSTVEGFSDTVVVRRGPEGYLYAVNRCPFNVTVTLKSAKLMAMTDLSHASVKLQGSEIKIELKPYELRSFQGSIARSEINIAGYDLPPERREMILQSIAKLKSKGEAGVAIAQRAQREMDKLNYVKCKYVLEERRSIDLLSQ